MSKDKEEIIEVPIKVKISYSSTEMREKAIECAKRELWLETWSTGTGGRFSAKVVRQ